MIRQLGSRLGKGRKRQACGHYSCSSECVKVPMLAHQVLHLMAYIFKASYSMSAMQANKI